MNDLIKHLIIENDATDVPFINEPACSAPALLAQHPPALSTAEELLNFVLGDPNLSKQQRANEASAIRALAKATKLPLSAIPLETEFLTDEVFGLSATEAGFSNDRWKHIRTLCGRALKRAGIWAVAVRRNNKLTIAWQLWLEKLPPYLRARLSAFARFCSKLGVEPDAVVEATFIEFEEEELTRTGKGKKAYKSCRMVRVTWNWAVEHVTGWPGSRVSVPNYANRFSLPKADFWPKFWEDLDRYADACTPKKHGNPFAALDKKACRRLSEKTIILHRELAWAMASAQVLKGRDITEIDGVEAMLDPVWVNQGLSFLWERYGTKTKRLHSFASTMHSIAKSWVRPSKEVLDALVSLCKIAWPDEEPGFSDKNLKTLLQFDSPELLRSLYTLPYAIAGAIRAKKVITPEDAWAVMIALAMELLLTSMVRLGNLTEIDIKKNLWPIGVDGGRLLTFPGIRVKNGQPLRFELSPRTWELWDFYVDNCRPLLVGTQPSTLLFPIAGDTKKREAQLRYHITLTVYRRLNIWVTPHQYRHIGVMVYLKQHPKDFHTPSVALGHKGEDTLKKYYTHISQQQVVKDFCAVVLAGRDQWIAELGF